MISTVLLLALAAQSPTDVIAEPADAAPLAPSVPEMLRPVVDAAGVLADDVDAELSRKLHAHKDESGVSVGVLLVKSLADVGGVTLADASAAASRSFVSGWGKDAAWVLVFVSVDDRKLRVEGDPRLKASFTEDDGLRLTTEATRHFAAGDLPAGLNVLVDGIIAETPRAPPDGEERVLLFLAAGAMGVVFVGLVVWLRRRQARRA